jgi:hypothetical protein
LVNILGGGDGVVRLVFVAHVLAEAQANGLYARSSAVSPRQVPPGSVTTACRL